MKLGLVLSGGGAKGAYEMGVYKALLRLGKYPDIVTGTSVGALNGVLVVQGDLRKGIKIWKNMNFSVVFDDNSFENCDNDNIAEVYAKYVKSFITEGGMDVTRLGILFDKTFNPRKFFKSKIDFGVVTYNLSKNKPRYVLKSEMTKDNVKDFVIASASCYPAFKPHKIDDELYIDGGYCDNLPIDLAFKLGAEEIIAVDLGSAGVKKKYRNKSSVITISPRNKVSSFLVFDKDKSKEALRFGFNDTMKVFNRLDGNLFTFRKGNLSRNYKKYADRFEHNLNSLFVSDNDFLNTLFNSSFFKGRIADKLSYRNFNELIENIGFCFDFPEDNIYDIWSYNKGIIRAISDTKPLKLDINEIINNKQYREVLDRRSLVRLYYNLICSNDINSLRKIALLFSSEFMMALYIYTINPNNNIY